MSRDLKLCWRRRSRDFVVVDRAGKVITVTDTIERGWRICESGQQALNEARAAAAIKRREMVRARFKARSGMYSSK